MNWEEINDVQAFDTSTWTDAIMALDAQNVKEIQQYYPISRNRLKYLVDFLRNEVFVDKDEVLESICICAIAQEPMLIFGKPGAAKTEMVMKFCEGLGIVRTQMNESFEQETKKLFIYLLNPYCEPDELLGPIDIEAYKAGKFQRFREGMITDAYVVFLDEIFLASSAILNLQLSLINERRVYEGGQAIKAKLRMFYGAANMPPKKPELEAYYNRFPIRMVSHLIPMENSQEQNRIELLEKGWHMEVQKLRAGYDPTKSSIRRDEKFPCLNDILLCNKALTELWGGKDLLSHDAGRFVGAYTRAVTAIARDKRQYCSIDDRKFIKLLKVVRARALFDGLRAPQIDDFIVLKDTWTEMEDQEPLAVLVQEVINTLKKNGANS